MPYLNSERRTVRPARVVAVPMGCRAYWIDRMVFGVALRLIEPVVLRIGCTARRIGLGTNPRTKLIGTLLAIAPKAGLSPLSAALRRVRGTILGTRGLPEYALAGTRSRHGVHARLPQVPNPRMNRRPAPRRHRRPRWCAGSRKLEPPEDLRLLGKKLLFSQDARLTQLAKTIKDDERVIGGRSR